MRGERVAELRRAAGWTQAQLATHAGTRLQRVGEWERGQAQPYAPQLHQLAAALGVPALELLDIDPADPPLLALRMAAGLTLSQLADATGLPYSTYRRLETGTIRGAPPDAAVRALAPSLHVSAEQIQRAVAKSQAARRTRP